MVPRRRAGEETPRRPRRCAVGRRRLSGAWDEWWEKPWVSEVERLEKMCACAEAQTGDKSAGEGVGDTAWANADEGDENMELGDGYDVRMSVARGVPPLNTRDRPWTPT